MSERDAQAPICEPTCANLECEVFASSWRNVGIASALSARSAMINVSAKKFVVVKFIG